MRLYGIERPKSRIRKPRKVARVESLKDILCLEVKRILTPSRSKPKEIPWKRGPRVFY